MRLFYEPTAEHIAKLTSSPWCVSYSGGKDSTSLVTWVEWLRRTGQIAVENPQLIQSDTTVEYPELQAISRDMCDLLSGCGWGYTMVEPRIDEKLYNRILGIGNIPIHPGIRRMRWCTRSTKTSPMERWRKTTEFGIMLTGLRYGESAMRDGKIKAHGCAAGGECGIPDPSERTYSPILNWSTCNVIDWLNGAVHREIQNVMSDVFAQTRKLVTLYGVKVGAPTLWGETEVTTVARFGCIGCPAIQAERHAPASSVRRHGADSPLGELYDVWFIARQRHNRCWKARSHVKQQSMTGYGPLKLSSRKQLFSRVMDIQRRAGVVLVTPDDEAFIRQCWAEKRYPRGWSEADEATMPPVKASLFGPDA